MIYLIALILGIWLVILYIANKKWKKYGLEVIGPILMWKTKKGRKFIDKLSKRNIWKYYGNVSILICVVAMLFTTFLLLWNLIISFKISPKSAPSPRLMIGIPGINPIIPIGYGVFALAIAIAAHEVTHGIMARFGKIRLNSLGLLFLIFPIGAFVEPNEEELKKVSRIKRSRVFAAGPATNIIIAFICLLLLSFLFSPFIHSKVDGAIVLNDIDGIKRWSVVEEIDGEKIRNVQELYRKNMIPGNFYNFTIYSSGKIYNESFLYGLYISNVVKDSPAYNAGFKKGYVIYRINEVYLEKWEDFKKLMENKSKGDEINVYYFNGNFSNKTLVLEDKYKFTKIEEDIGKGFFGVSAYGIKDLVINVSYFKSLLNPLQGKFLSYIVLPFNGLSPLPKDIASIYTPSNYFWMLYDITYWIFWLNFAIGTFNALPAIPLDGGYIFKDGMNFLVYKLTRKKERTEKIAAILSNFISLMILFCIFSIIIIPRISFLFR